MKNTIKKEKADEDGKRTTTKETRMIAEVDQITSQEHVALGPPCSRDDSGSAPWWTRTSRFSCPWSPMIRIDSAGFVNVFGP